MASGTIRSNQLLDRPLKSDQELRKKGRRARDYRVTEDKDVVIVSWHDNGPVNMVSTIVAVGKTKKVKRWSESLKQNIEIDCPEAIAAYKDFTGGVDKLDFF